jgi:hypothetical protein
LRSVKGGEMSPKKTSSKSIGMNIQFGDQDIPVVITSSKKPVLQYDIVGIELS